jgi:hypothetical protein
MRQPSIFDTEAQTQVSSAVFSPCRKYRYVLWRGWAENWAANYLMFIGLNPSTADERINDPTVRRCIGFARDLGYSGLCMTNLFSYRATNPKDMFAEPEPIGLENDQYLVDHATQAEMVIAAWGCHGKHLNRDAQVINMLSNLYCLKLTKGGSPQHPLYLPRELKPISLVNAASHPPTLSSR